MKHRVNWRLLAGGVFSCALRERPGFLFISLFLCPRVFASYLFCLKALELHQLHFTPTTAAAASLSLCLFCLFLAEQHETETGQVTFILQAFACQCAE